MSGLVSNLGCVGSYRDHKYPTGENVSDFRCEEANDRFEYDSKQVNINTHFR